MSQNTKLEGEDNKQNPTAPQVNSNNNFPTPPSSNTSSASTSNNKNNVKDRNNKPSTDLNKVVHVLHQLVLVHHLRHQPQQNKVTTDQAIKTEIEKQKINHVIHLMHLLENCQSI